MVPKQFHWLEVAEFLALGVAVVYLFLAIASQDVLFPLIFVTLALIFNGLNRLRWQYESRKRLAKAIKQIERDFSQQIQNLTISPPVPSESRDNVEISQLQNNLISVEQSLNGVVHYLNAQMLPERVELLEKFCGQLSQERQEAAPHPLETSRPEEASTDPSETITSAPVSPLNSVSTTTQLPTVPLTPSVSPSLVVPDWICLYTLTEHEDAISSLAISPDGQWLASGSWDQTLRIWDLATGTPKGRVTAHSQGLLAVVFGEASGSNYQIATGSFDQTLKLWLGHLDDSEQFSLTLEGTLTNHTGSVQSLALSRQSLLLISGSYDQTIKQWELPRGEMHCSSYDPLGAIYAIAVYAPHRLIASAGGDGRVTLWQLGSGEKIGFLSGNVSSVESLAISSDGQTLAAGCIDGSIKVWQLDPSQFGADYHLQPVRTLNAHSGQVKALVFSEQEQILFSGGADGYLKIWHPSRRDAIAFLTISDDSQTRRNAILSLAFCEDRQLLIAGSADGTIKIWQTVLREY